MEQKQTNKTNAKNIKKLDEDQLRKRLKTLFKNRLPPSVPSDTKNHATCAKKKSMPTTKSNGERKVFNHINKPSANQTNLSNLGVSDNGKAQSSKKHSKGSTSAKVNGVDKKTAAAPKKLHPLKPKKNKSKSFKSNENNMPKQENHARFNKKTKRKRKISLSKNTPPKKQKLKATSAEMSKTMAPFSSSDMDSYSDKSVETTFASEIEDDDICTGSEFSFSNFQDEREDDFDTDEDCDDYEFSRNCSWGQDDDSIDNSDDTASFSDFNETDELDDEDFCSSTMDDEDYHLPEHVLEDLIIHQGTAQKRNLEQSDKVFFLENVEGAQVIELSEQVSIKVIQQPEEYLRTRLEELNKKEIIRNTLDIKPANEESIKLRDDNDEGVSDGTECPQLVPIVDEDGFQLYSEELENSDMDIYDSFESSCYEECSDQDGSVVSVDINSKYLQSVHDSNFDSSTEEDDSNAKRNRRMKNMYADVIEVTKDEDFVNCQQENKSIEDAEVANLLDVLPSQSLASNFNDKKEKSAIIKATKVMTAASKISFQTEETRLHSPEVEVNATLNQLTSENLINANIIDPVGQASFPLKTPLQPTERTTQNFTTYHSIFCNAIDSNHVLVLLREPLNIYGTLKLIPIAGSIEIYGYTAKCGEELEIFSPRGLSSVQIVATPNQQTTNEDVDRELKHLQAFFSNIELNKIREAFSLKENALVLLKRNEQRKKLINTLKKYMSENLFPHMLGNSAQTERPFYASECRLRCFINTTSDCTKPLIINPQWSALKVCANSKIMLIGGKSVGKSTLLRYIVNRHLSPQQPRMLLVDLDIGQPELFVPQTISASLLEQPLLGPGFFLNKQPLRAYAIGHSNIVLCPHRYMKAVKKLVSYCRTQAEYAQMPWIINTMGYNKGFGAELIAVLCECLTPTDVVQLQSNKEINNFDYHMEPHVVAALPRSIFAENAYHSEECSAGFLYKFHIFNSAILQEGRYQRHWEMSAKDMRYAIMLARISEALIGNAEWLSDCKPLSASLDSLKLLNLLSSDATREQMLKCIEANLVYLCHLEEDESSVQCFGIGVVRAIDYHVGQVFLLPALPHALMSEINCLAIGEMPLPTSILTNQGPKVKEMAPYVYNTLAANASKSIKQIYHRAAEFLTGKHKII